MKAGERQNLTAPIRLEASKAIGELLAFGPKDVAIAWRTISNVLCESPNSWSTTTTTTTTIVTTNIQARLEDTTSYNESERTK